MSDLSQDAIITALSAFSDPVSGKSLTDAGMVQSVRIEGGHVLVSLEIDPSQAKALEEVRQNAERAVRALDGVLTCNVVLTAERAAQPSGPQPRPRPKPSAPDGAKKMSTPGGGGPGGGMLELPTIRSIVPVASGKGGVGKSTTTMNLALALAAKGLSVGVLDADVYGPSIPRMAGVPGIKPESRDGKLQPVEAHGIKVMSIGFLVDEEQPVIWRGPMVMGALEQLLRAVNWGDLDILVIDMPPGTGDAQLSMAQRVALTGAVIVSTPQDIALLDARKGLNMFRQVNVPVLGFVENMSYYQCPSCGHVDHVFDHGGAAKAADEMNVPFLGEIPLDIKIRLSMDGGNPVTVSEPEGNHAKAYGDIAEKLWQSVEAKVGPKEAPKKSWFPKISFS